VAFDEDELLAQGLGNLGARMGSPAGRGAVKSMRFLRKQALELDLLVSMSPDAAAARARQVISEQGQIVHIEDAGDGLGRRVIGLVGSGAANLNPTVVTVTIHPAPEGSRLVIRGAAMEGLIKQRAGAKAAKRLAAALAPEAADSRPN
jgi:hypothetical protein